MKIPLFKIYWDKNDIKAMSSVIRSGTNWAIGPHVEQFEKKMANFVGTEHAVSFNSGTSALHALMLAYGFGPGDEIIVPPFSFVATANAPVLVGAKPVFAEIEGKTFGLDPKDIEKRITKKTKAIMPMHYGGSACQIKEIKKIADKNNLILIEDAAESLGTMVGKKKVGTFGDSAMFSFCGPKVITTGEGGVIVTNNRTIYEKMKMIRSHGRLETANYFLTSDYMDYVQLGYNFRMSDITAALGISQLKKIDKVIKMRRENAQYLTNKLAGCKEIIIPDIDKNNFVSYQMYTIELKSGKKTRDSLKDYLNKRGIMAKVYFEPIHLTKFYRDKFRYRDGDLPITEKISSQVLTLPMYPALTKKEMDYIAVKIKNFWKNV
ncbi:MAG: DegT/DnrJ/EryC1/StrS family aminotransferase [Candidatus Staskawiczbacteria bacterium]|jgi:perosamine synthetase